MGIIIAILTIIIALLVTAITKLYNSNDNLRGMINYATKEDEKKCNKIFDLEAENEHLYKELKFYQDAVETSKKNAEKTVKKEPAKRGKKPVKKEVSSTKITQTSTKIIAEVNKK